MNDVAIKIVLGLVLLIGNCLIFFPLAYSSRFEDIKRRRRARQAKSTVEQSHDRYVADHISGKLSARLDDAYKFSRYYATHKTLNTSYRYFRATLIVSAVMLFALFLAFGALFGLAGFALTWVISYGRLEFYRMKNGIEIKSDMITFLDMLGAYSAGNNEIVSIFLLIAKSFKPCLQGCLLECVAESQGEKGALSALDNLGRKIENRKFREILKNIAVSAKYDNDFSETVTQLRQDVTSYLSVQKDIEQTVRNNCTIMLISVASMLFVVAAAGMINGENMFLLAVSTIIGRICIGIFLGTIGFFTVRMMEARKA